MLFFFVRFLIFRELQFFTCNFLGVWQQYNVPDYFKRPTFATAPICTYAAVSGTSLILTFKFRGIISRFVKLQGSLLDRSTGIAAAGIKPLTDGRLHPFFPHRQHGHGHRNNQNPEPTTTTTAPASTAASQNTPENKLPSTPTASQPPADNNTPLASQPPPENNTPQTSQPPQENKPTPSTEDWSQVLSGATEAGKLKPESITRKIINLPCRGLTARDGTCRQAFDD